MDLIGVPPTDPSDLSDQSDLSDSSDLSAPQKNSLTC